MWRGAMPIDCSRISHVGGGGKASLGAPALAGSLRGSKTVQTRSTGASYPSVRAAIRPNSSLRTAPYASPPARAGTASSLARPSRPGAAPTGAGGARRAGAPRVRRRAAEAMPARPSCDPAAAGARLLPLLLLAARASGAVATGTNWASLANGASATSSGVGCVPHPRAPAASRAAPPPRYKGSAAT